MVKRFCSGSGSYARNSEYWSNIVPHMWRCCKSIQRKCGHNPLDCCYKAHTSVARNVPCCQGRFCLEVFVQSHPRTNGMLVVPPLEPDIVCPILWALRGGLPVDDRVEGESLDQCLSKLFHPCGMELAKRRIMLVGRCHEAGECLQWESFKIHFE